MPERIDELLEAVSSYWAATSVPPSVVQGMQAELEAHLQEAQAHGRSVDEVVGPDPARFAEQWAEVHRPYVAGMPTWEETTTSAGKRTISSGPILATLATAVAFVAIGLVFGREEEVPMEDIENWRWIWLAVAAVFGIGEMLTAGFFLLPFAVGAAVSAVLAWVGVGVAWQWAAFLVTSVAGLVFMRRFTADEQPGPNIGANRYAGAAGTIIEAVDPTSGAGSVRIETEVWRAAADEPIEAGTAVRIVSVSGTRMRVERVNE